MIKKILEELAPLTIIDYDKGKYYYKGLPVPRVTEVLSSMLHEDFLMSWSNRLGLFKRVKYEDELNKAATIGTYAHEFIDQYIKTNMFNSEDFRLEIKNNIIYNSVYNSVCSFIQWYEDISKCNKIEIVGQEQQLSCPWFGGTYDLLINIDGKIYLTDFKTSNHISYKYFLQLAAYRYMIRESLGIDIDGCIILQVDKKCVHYEEYVLNFTVKEHLDFIQQCEITFFSLIYGYINRKITENMYKQLF